MTEVSTMVRLQANDFNKFRVKLAILPEMLYNIIMVRQLPNETREQFLSRQRELARRGGLKRKGTKNKSTIDRERMLSQFQDFVARKSKTLLASQLALGVGSLYVFRIDTEIIGSGKNEKRFKKKPVLVQDIDEIINALDFYYAEGESPNNDQTYYFITTKDPENKAIDSLLDRTFGKPKESIEMKHSGELGLYSLLNRNALDTKEDDALEG